MSDLEIMCRPCFRPELFCTVLVMWRHDNWPCSDGYESLHVLEA